ncbi:MAG TPA: hypothetical protein VGL28_08200 [Steroidobacteraceae bacterium]|jgi:hypothetical protein
MTFVRPPFATCDPRAVPLLASSVLLLLFACSDGSMPMLRERAAAGPDLVAPANGSDPVAAQCDQLNAQIRSNLQSRRQAPTTSTSPQIVAAAQAKADQRIDDVRTSMAALDCPDSSEQHAQPTKSDSAEQGRPLAPLPPAPGTPIPSGNLP